MHIKPRPTAEAILPTSTKILPSSAIIDPFEMSLSGERSPHSGIANRRRVYSYEPIRNAGEIRPLSLRPGKPGDTIKADIEIARIRGSRVYDAISYTWADENNDVTKCCSVRIGDEGLLLPITRNCDAVLRRVRKYTDTAWIDAVCINQEDIQERGKQIDLMPDIYTGASRTFAYVGEASDNGDIVLRNLAGGIWTPPYLLEPFFRRPYFSRVWIVQEVALSNRFIIMCGDTAVNWTSSMLNGHLKQIYTQSYYETFPTLFHLDPRHSSRSATVRDALVLGRLCNASDPRDRVFGLMGLVSANERLSADYSLSTAEVYTRMAIYYYKAHLWRLDTILGNLCYRNDQARAQIPNLPTWVPDWNECGPTLLQRLPLARGFLEDQDAIFGDNNAQGLYLRGSIVGTLYDFEDNENTQTLVYLSNSRARGLIRLPSVYRYRRVYVFSTCTRRGLDLELGRGWQGSRQRPVGENLSQTYGFFPELALHAFLVARTEGGRTADIYPSTQREGSSQESLGAIGSDGLHNYELLGLVEIMVNGELDKIASQDSLVYATVTGRTPPLPEKKLDQGRKDNTEIGGPCTIRIV